MSKENIFCLVFADYHFQSFFFIRLFFSTVGYTTSSIQLRWSNISENPVALNQTSLPQFEVTGRNYSNRERTHRFRGDTNDQSYTVTVYSITVANFNYFEKEI